MVDLVERAVTLERMGAVRGAAVVVMAPTVQ
jgi:hypothetical protein